MPACRRIAVCCALLSALSARAGELVILVPTATEMPMARFEGYVLVDGVHRDLGLALAGATGRQPRFIAIPRKRIVETLQSGKADVLCNSIPEWLAGRLSWTQPFLPMTEVVITDRATKRPRSLSDISGHPVGTILGYTYPELEGPLGKGFVREDSTSTEANMRKLAAGRLRHMVTLKSFVDYRLKVGDPVLVLHPPLGAQLHGPMRGIAEGKGDGAGARSRSGEAGARRHGRGDLCALPVGSAQLETVTFSTKYSVSPKQALGTPLCWA